MKIPHDLRKSPMTSETTPGSEGVFLTALLALVAKSIAMAALGPGGGGCGMCWRNVRGQWDSHNLLLMDVYIDVFIKYIYI